MCWHGTTVCKLRNLLDIFVALLGKKQQLKNPTVKQSPGYCKGLQEEGKTRYIYDAEKQTRSCYSLPVQALSAEGSTG